MLKYIRKNIDFRYTTARHAYARKKSKAAAGKRKRGTVEKGYSKQQDSRGRSISRINIRYFIRFHIFI